MYCQAVECFDHDPGYYPEVLGDEQRTLDPEGKKFVLKLLHKIYCGLLTVGIEIGTLLTFPV